MGSLRLIEILVFQRDILLRRIGQKSALTLRKRTQLSGGVANIDVTGFQGFSGRDHAARAHHDLSLNDDAIINDRAYPDQDPVLDGTAMQNSAVTNNNIVAYIERKPVWIVILTGMRDMQNRVVLHVGTVAYSNVVHVTTDDCARPHRNILAKFHIAYHRGRRVNVDSLPKCWGDAIKGSNRVHHWKGNYILGAPSYCSMRHGG